MTTVKTPPVNSSKPQLPFWVGAVLVLLLAAVVVLLGLLGTSIMERRWEAQRPALVLKPIDQWETDNAKWGENYPHEYEGFKKTMIDDTKTLYGGAFPRDYLDADPMQVVLFGGYGFSKDYLQARGHYWAVEDASKTKRIKTPFNPATCWSCKSPDVPRLMNKMGVKEFYAANFHDLKGEVTHPIGCLDCHDPETMNLRISRPALREAFTAMGKDIDQASHQEMRSLVCAQCHVEYYFKNVPEAGMKNYLTFPWTKGTDADSMIAYYDAANFSDWDHPVSKTRMIKAQHPDYEMYMTGIHAYRNVSCADCHMPYKTEGGVKFTDHHVQSPLLNISNSCSVCHRWSEQEVRQRVEAIQTKVFTVKQDSEKALAQAHFDMAAAMQAGVTDEQLAPARQMLRHAQFRWDYVSANNGMGFHSPQESLRVLSMAINEAQQVRLQASRLLAGKGIAAEPAYPDYSARDKAAAAIQGFIDNAPAKLLP